MMLRKNLRLFSGLFLLILLFSIEKTISKQTGITTIVPTAATAPVTAGISQKKQKRARRDRVDERSIAEVMASSGPDRFTQTEAHLFLQPVRELIQQYYAKNDLAPHLDVVSAAIANEAEYKNTHYAFYNTTPNAWRLAQDVYTRLNAHANPNAIAKDFKFLRFNDEGVNSTPKGFLINELKEKGLVDDNTSTGLLMLSVNFSLFGNVGFPGECSWDYFVHPQGHAEPIRAIYENMMNKFGYSHKYIDELIALAKIYDTKEDTIVQILVPISRIDEIGYLAWVKGIPAHGPTIKEVLRQTGGSKKFLGEKGQKGTKETLEKLAEKFAQNKNNKLYKDMLEHIEAGDYSLEKFLKVYRNKPWDLKEMNNVTGRLLFTPTVLLNPKSGVKFFRFSTVSHDKLKEYNNKLNSIIKRMIAEKGK